MPGARQNQEGLNAMWFPILVQVKLLLRLVNETFLMESLTLKKDNLNDNLESCQYQHTQRVVLSGDGVGMIPKI